jgi:hypothetical protein
MDGDNLEPISIDGLVFWATTTLSLLVLLLLPA